MSFLDSPKKNVAHLVTLWKRFNRYVGVSVKKVTRVSQTEAARATDLSFGWLKTQ